MKLLLIIFVMFLLSPSLYGDVYYSVNAGCEDNKVGVEGGRVFEKDGKTPLSLNSIVQYIYVGPDGKINFPTNGGDVSEDDIILKTFKVGSDSVWLIFKDKPGLFYNGLSGALKNNVQQVKLYIRAWSNKTGFYGDSEVFTAESSRVLVPAPNDIGISSFITSIEAKND